METFELGPFELVDYVGEGTMGRVYRGRHPASEVEVAVKVMTSDRAREGEFRRDFRREVQAMAQLTHPAIAAVYDLGEITPETCRRANGLLPEGSPWLGMEFVEGVSVTELPESWGWHRIQWVLLEVLDALAHSHAVGVIHRDLKPSNILVREAGASSIDVKIVDFGVSRILDPDAEAERGEIEEHIAGTPKYMAPEQVLGRRRDQGPWTDLYAVGCLAWTMTTGSPPYDEGEVQEIFEKHLGEPLPEYRPRLGVPDGMERWLHSMLSKHPDRRFQRAADASHALLELSGLTGASNPKQRRSGGEGEVRTTADVALEDTGVEEERPDLELDTGQFQLDALRGGGSLAANDWPLPPIPEDWRRPGEPDQPRQLRGAGLGLFGLRRVPVVDREPERNLLWEELRAAAREERPRMVILSGPAGGGKDRVAEWLLRRSHEVGGAHVFHARHSDRGSASDGIGPMLARKFRSVGLDPDRIAARLERVYEALGITGARAHHEIRSLARLMAEGEDVEPGFETPQARHQTLAQLFGHLGNWRPSVMWLQDVDRGAESLSFAEFLVEAGLDETPLLGVLTVSEEAQSAHPPVREALERLRDREYVRTYEIGPLDEEAQRRLVEQILGLEPSTADEVARRTEGNPMFAVQLLRDWVERDRLEMTDGGYALEEGAEVDVPDDIHNLWRQRIRESLAQIDDADRRAGRRALELVAVLGPEVQSAEWEAVADRAGLAARERLLEAMFRRGLAERREEGWAIAHGLLRESLERDARSRGDWSELHETAADLLLELYDLSDRGIARRVAQHLEQSGRREPALHYVQTAVQQALDSAEYEEARELLQRQRDIIERLESPAGRFEVDYLVLRGELGGRMGEPGEALERAEEAVDRARDEELEAELGAALRLRAALRRETGALDGALEDATEALDALEATGDREGRARAHYILGRVHQIRGEMEESVAHFEEALKWYETIGDRSMVALTTCDLGYLAITDDDHEIARSRLEDALAIAQEIGNQRVAAKSWNRLGEIARFEQDWDEARSAYRKAQELFRVPRNRHVANLNLAFVELADGNYSEAESYFQLLEPSFESAGIHYPQVMFGQSCCDAANGEWERWDEHVDAGVSSLEASGMAHPDLPWLAEKSGKLARYADELGRAERAYRVAAEQWRALGDEQRAAGAEAILDRLEEV